MRKLIICLLRCILDAIGNPPEESDNLIALFEVELSDDSITKIKGVFDMSEIREGGKKRLKLKLLTAHGNPATPEPGSCVWTSSVPDVVSITPDPNDQTQADIEGLNGVGALSSLVECRGDGRVGEGVKPFVVSGSYTCTQGDVATGSFDETDIDEAPPVEPEKPAPVEGAGGEGEAKPELVEEKTDELSDEDLKAMSESDAAAAGVSERWRKVNFPEPANEGKAEITD